MAVPYLLNLEHCYLSNRVIRQLPSQQQLPKTSDNSLFRNDVKGNLSGKYNFFLFANLWMLLQFMQWKKRVTVWTQHHAPTFHNLSSLPKVSCVHPRVVLFSSPRSHLVATGGIHQVRGQVSQGPKQSSRPLADWLPVGLTNWSKTTKTGGLDFAFSSLPSYINDSRKPHSCWQERHTHAHTHTRRHTTHIPLFEFLTT